MNGTSEQAAEALMKYFEEVEAKYGKELTHVIHIVGSVMGACKAAIMTCPPGSRRIMTEISARATSSCIKHSLKLANIENMSGEDMLKLVQKIGDDAPELVTKGLAKEALSPSQGEEERIIDHLFEDNKFEPPKSDATRSEIRAEMLMAIACIADVGRNLGEDHDKQRKLAMGVTKIITVLHTANIINEHIATELKNTLERLIELHNH